MLKFKNIRYAFLMACSLIMMVSCTKEQSATGGYTRTAQIVGNFTYDQGQSFSAGEYSRLIKPVAGVKVEVTMSAKGITADSKATGDVTFETITDENGNYQITVPVSNAGVEVTVRAEDFRGKYYSIAGVTNGTPICQEDEVVYTCSSVNMTLKPNDIKINNGTYTHTAITVEEGYPYLSKFIVNVGEARYSLRGDNSVVEIHKSYFSASGVDVIITVKYQDKSLKFVAASNSSGEAVFNIPTKEKKWNPTITVTAKPYVENRFIYYKNENNQTTYEQYVLGGVYEQANQISSSFQFEELEGMPVPECNVKMNFKPFADTEDYGYSTSEWSNVTF